MLFLPELTLLITGLVLFLVSLGKPGDSGLRTLVRSLMSLVLLASVISIRQNGLIFFESYQVNLFTQVFKVLIAAATLVVLIFSGSAPGIKKDVKAEYYLFLFMAVLGLMMLVSSVELLAIFVSLELSGFAVYILVPLRRTDTGTVYQVEAAIKYLLFGVMASGFMLFGMSYLFGLSGSTYLSVIVPAIGTMSHQPAAIIATMLVLAGFFYKLAIFPFHFWVPDVYEGAANETTAFISAVPKIAAVAVLIRLLTMISAERETVALLLLVCSVASMFYGNLCALAQTDIKRMLGYSGISHAGFVLFGLLTLQMDGYSTALYYVVGYAVMNLACFLVICTIATSGENLKISDLAGLHKRAPLLAVTLATGLFALAGIPPFVGFTGKFMLLVHAFKQGYVLAVILAALNTAIALYYYLSVVRFAYCTEPGSEDSAPFADNIFLTNTVSVILLVIIIAMGVAPAGFLKLASATIQTIL
ncbi:MAG: NADH-quinone oxidoreductase subunit N [Desulfocapsaceae bacterium]|jgi:NADH-quinone oxidoreductase subunit N|nr:NADH-quinone oxidoreductase subunit N [Desulfocapsaceae bacterium]